MRLNWSTPALIVRTFTLIIPQYRIPLLYGAAGKSLVYNIQSESAHAQATKLPSRNSQGDYSQVGVSGEGQNTICGPSRDYFRY